MVRIEKLRVNVTVEGDATDGKAKFGQLFQEFMELYEDRQARSQCLTRSMASDRELKPRKERR